MLSAKCWIPIGCHSSAGKDCSESDSNDIVPLCHYLCSCGVDFPVIELERLLKLIVIVTI